MARYLFIYHGGGEMPSNQDEIDAMMKAWGDWFQGMGAAVKDPGNPVGKSSTVSADGVAGDGGSNPVSGYSIIEASSQDEANAHAKDCPMLQHGGSVEVTEIIELEM